MTSRDWVATYHKPKGFVNPLELVAEDIHIEDIQHALSNICRFNGHCREFYSVAQHSVHVCEWLARNGYDIETQFIGLLHDTSEAYLGDIVRPLKKMPLYSQYLDIELDVTRKIMNKFLPTNVNWIASEYQDAVARADNDILVSEAVQLFPIQPKDWNMPYPVDYFHIKPVTPRDAKLLFEAKFHELMVVLQEG